MKFCYYDGKGTPNHGFCKCYYCEKRRKRKAKRAVALPSAESKGQWHKPECTKPDGTCDCQDPSELFSSVYDLLVSIGGAHRLDKGIFVHNHSKENPCEEWRFQGLLGFGGKYRRKTNRVDCYREDETPERLAIMERLNAELAKLPNR